MVDRLLGSSNRSRCRKSKIVATVGPSCKSDEKIRRLIQAGVNVFRLNFSHGSHEEHTEYFESIRRVSTEMGEFVATLQDLSGPKIRISEVDGNFVNIIDNREIELRYSDGSKSNDKIIFVEAVNPVKILKPGDHILLADGILELQAREVKKDRVKCLIVKGGRIRSRVGIAFPDSSLELPATTEKDMHDLKWGIEHKVDYCAVSFVNNAHDVQKVRDAIIDAGGDVRIIAKIERKEALENIDEILDISDGLMVARGDLGVELPLEQLPMLQKRLIELANYRGIPAIVATQMLHSMVTSIRPTRAEVSDIAAAVMNGADALMLSEETSIGQNPIEAVEYLGKIALEAEKSFAFTEYKLRLRDSDRETVPDAVAYAAAAAAIKVNAAAIIACTETGTSARLVAKYRPQQPLYGAANKEATLRRMSLYWGVRQISCARTSTHFDETQTALKTVQLLEQLPNGARAVVTGGLATGKPGSTSVLEIREMSYN